MNIFHHTGDLGDVIAALPVIRELGGGELVFSNTQYPHGKGPRETVVGARYHAVKTIFQATDYINNISFQTPPVGVTHDIAEFRETRWICKESLIKWQGRHFDLDLPDAPEPWLRVDAPKHGKIVIGRSQRYRTDFFPWRLIAKKFQKDIIFLGLPQEYIEFQNKAGVELKWEPTETLLDATEIISGARMFIGNQSVLFWIAAALGVALCQETHHELYTRNSIVPRPNAFYTDTQDNLLRMYDLLGLDKSLAVMFDVPAVAVNLSTSAQDVRKNLSTSAEIYDAINRQNEDTIRRARVASSGSAPGFI